MRSISSEPLMVRFSAVGRERWRAGARAATGSAVSVGVAVGAVCLIVGALVGDSVLASVMLALGVTFPGLLLQDAWRYAFFSDQRGAAAFVNDLAWAAGLAASLAFFLWTGRDSVAWLVIAWGASGSAAALLGAWQARVVPSPVRTVSWFRDHKDLIPRFVSEFGITTFASQVSLISIGAVAGLAAVGAIRAGQLLFGPLNVVYMGVGLASLPEAVRLLRSSTAALRRASVWISIALASSALAVGAIVALMPEGIGVALLGENWEPARAIVLPLSIWMAGFGTAVGAGIGLRALAAARLSLRVRLIVAPIGITASVLGAVVGGAKGAAWGFAVAACIGAVIWWRYFVRGSVEGRRRTPEEAVSVDETEPLLGGDDLGV